MPKSKTRDQIISAADMLFYQQGFEACSFADIAAEVEISRGNFYHHFKTKDEILDAVIAHRQQNTRQMLKDWEADRTPTERIKCFIRILITNQTKIIAYGCPVGTLSTELAKLDHPSQSGVRDIFALIRDWLATQFEALGQENAEGHALQMLSFSQGIATLANAFRDKDYVSAEVEAMCAHIDHLAKTT